MEIVSADGSRTQIEPGQTRELGRSDGLDSSDKTISRRHLSFFVPPNTQKDQETHIQFEVIGRNPIYVSRNDEVKIFRRFERGEMGDGDMFCVSAKYPVWYSLKTNQSGGETVRENDLETKLAGNLESDLGYNGVEDLGKDGIDISDINPVKEFGFVIMGHEFESYPKKLIRDIKNFDWFIEETSKESDDEDEKGKKGMSGRKKRKKGAENDDEEWTGESEDDKELINKSRKAQKPKYITRSKDHGKDTRKNKSTGTTSYKKRNMEVDDDEDEDEDDDETLGGFIVDDENLEEEREEEQDEEEIEEEYDENE